ncbi:MAG: phosphatidate cytidylyltransferase [Candidatus Nanopelagicaceae bacterium]|nr:phosphatidate cytidylyltransferase [Candidatus Nanopelagicaceae bacterium]
MSDLHALNEAINKKAGRKLFPSIAVGLTLLGLVIASLAFQRVLFLPLAIAAIIRGVWELGQALDRANIEISVPTISFCAVAIMTSAWIKDVTGLAVATAISIPFLLISGLPKGHHNFVKNATATVFATIYLPFLAGFLIVLAKPDDGLARVMTFVIVVGCNDTFGYIFGVLLGKHKLAPAISPKKTWEGLIGSLIFSILGGGLMLSLLFEKHWLVGAAIGVAAVFTATCGDLIESAIKRDLDLKDMGVILPGHGGMLDRLDSVLLSAPIIWAILTLVG